MLPGCKFVFENAQTVYLYLDAVAGLNGSHSCGRTGRNQVAGFKRHDLGDVAEQIGDGEDQIAGRGLLSDDAVEPRDQCDGSSAGRVNLVGDDRADGAEGVETLAAGPLSVGLLNVARGDVVDADVAANVGANVFVGADLVAATCDDDAELALEVY